MINRGGLKIYSAEVESVLAGHPDVVESAIIAKPCPVLGERVHAVVVTRDAVGGRGPARLVRRAAVGLQGAGDDGPHLGAAAAQRQRQGDEAAVARGLAAARGLELTATDRCAIRVIRVMSIDHHCIGMGHDRHEPDEASSQRPKRIPVNPVHDHAWVPTLVACLGHA